MSNEYDPHGQNIMTAKAMISIFTDIPLRVPNRFSGSGIWHILRPGFGIFGVKESEIRDCRYERDTRFEDFTKRDSGNIALKKRDPGSPVTKCTKKIKLSSL